MYSPYRVLALVDPPGARSRGRSAACCAFYSVLTTSLVVLVAMAARPAVLEVDGAIAPPTPPRAHPPFVAPPEPKPEVANYHDDPVLCQALSEEEGAYYRDRRALDRFVRNGPQEDQLQRSYQRAADVRLKVLHEERARVCPIDL
jgi:hypothetical protein